LRNYLVQKGFIDGIKHFSFFDKSTPPCSDDK